jgi:hypothetical protein
VKLLQIPRIVLLLTLFFVAELVLFFTIFASPGSFVGKGHVWEIFIHLAILSFVSLLYFINRIDTWWKVVLYGIFIPFSCLEILNLTIHLASAANGATIKPSLYSFFSIQHIVNVLIHTAYFDISLIFICAAFFFFSRRSRKILNADSKLFSASRHIKRVDLSGVKFVMFSTFIYIIFIMLYSAAIMPNGPTVIQGIKYSGGFPLLSKLLQFVVHVYLLSFVSILIIFPSVSSNNKVVFVCCLVFPLAWGLLIKVAYAFMVIVVVGGTDFFTEAKDVFHAKFYFEHYIKSRAWFASFPLLVNFGFYKCIFKLS